MSADRPVPVISIRVTWRLWVLLIVILTLCSFGLGTIASDAWVWYEHLHEAAP